MRLTTVLRGSMQAVCGIQTHTVFSRTRENHGWLVMSSETIGLTHYLCPACGDKIPYAAYDHKCWVQDKSANQENLAAPLPERIAELAEQLLNDKGKTPPNAPHYLDASGNYREW